MSYSLIFCRPKPNYQHWYRMEYWSLLEASYLLCDCEPEYENYISFRERIDPLLLGEIARTHEMVHRSFMSGTLKRSTTAPLYELYVEPREFLKWASLKRLSIPEELKDLYEGDNLEVMQMPDQVAEYEQTDNAIDEAILKYGTAAENLYNCMVTRLKSSGKSLTSSESAERRAAAVAAFDANPKSFDPLSMAEIDVNGPYEISEKSKRKMIGTIILHALVNTPCAKSNYQDLYGRFNALKPPSIYP